ncbi:DeoR family transcriptional regulator [Dactylosporangium sp. NBC_01737]|uniref:DeoR family transcriptional regulator n=1 Tax=Dactylosporangium sp. NBC_01737 TaxID=2975959 RepID=UPI002E1679DA|nr:DeoR family transcriptional regulator [Dactylosporangium sp. NBC_01737]
MTTATAGPVLPAVRHRQILALLAEREFIALTEVQEATGTSAATAHRDLSLLAAAGALTRIRGRATRAAPPPAAPPGEEGPGRLPGTGQAGGRPARPDGARGRPGAGAHHLPAAATPPPPLTYGVCVSDHIGEDLRC